MKHLQLNKMIENIIYGFLFINVNVRIFKITSFVINIALQGNLQCNQKKNLCKNEFYKGKYYLKIIKDAEFY